MQEVKFYLKLTKLFSSTQLIWLSCNLKVLILINETDQVNQFGLTLPIQSKLPPFQTN